jgi:hypothetical protein
MLVIDSRSSLDRHENPTHPTLCSVLEKEMVLLPLALVLLIGHEPEEAYNIVDAQSIVNQTFVYRDANGNFESNQKSIARSGLTSVTDKKQKKRAGKGKPFFFWCVLCVCV